MIQSHTGALAGNSEILAAFLRRCGIVQVDRYDEFVETIELFAIAPRDETVGRDIVVISGSGGGAAIAADALQDAGAALASLHPTTQGAHRRPCCRSSAASPIPIDGTGAIYDDPALLPKIVDAILTDPGPAGDRRKRRRQAGGQRDHAALCPDIRRCRARRPAAPSSPISTRPLGGPLDSEIVKTLHDAQVPLLLGISNAMGALKHLPLRRDYWTRAAATTAEAPEQPGSRLESGRGGDPSRWDFLTARQALVASGVPVVDAALAHSEDEAVALLRRFSTAVAVKAEAPGLLHKSDLGCVRLGCADEQAVRDAYAAVVRECAQRRLRRAAC